MVTINSKQDVDENINDFSNEEDQAEVSKAQREKLLKSPIFIIATISYAVLIILPFLLVIPIMLKILP